ncbi:hypothetical protein CJF42_13070 [Pseudoalteromonas sp. NBT06-2]|uniref:hypothetical protein n=1 Tax=Pseudoalteromonas sp. NBT06-2 TaxID=2025950 RepID=UPI000BA5FD44|nr:hypothetical protein [Pseudoalteromonas sp. NBT06-2]PAJ73981.1 hypothetical protein CJF42_13070 [Pseudoalteromonas sp. NBT06-2]
MENLDFNTFCKSILSELSKAYPFSKTITFSDIHKNIQVTYEQRNFHNSVIEFLINEKLIRKLPIKNNALCYYQLTPKGFKLFSKNEQICF